MTKAEKIALGKKILTDKKNEHFLIIVKDRYNVSHLHLCITIDDRATSIITHADLDLTDIYVQIAELAEKAVAEVSNGECELKPFGILDGLQHGRS